MITSDGHHLNQKNRKGGVGDVRVRVATVSSEELGPHLVAKENITIGTVILREKPVLTLVESSRYVSVLKKKEDDAPCYGCGTSYASHRCKLCSLPICSEICSKMENHTEWECKYIVQNELSPLPTRPPDMSSTFLDILDINMIRMHLLSGKNHSAYKQMLELRNHPRVLALKAANPLFHELTKNIELESWAYLSSDFCHVNNKLRGQQNIQMDVLAIMMMMPINLQTPNLAYLYPTLTKWITHSCVPNTDFVVSDVNDEVVLVAGHDIQVNQRIEINLWPIDTWTTSARKAFLNTVYIKCDCQRCLDQTELNSNISALPCAKSIHGANCGGFCYPNPTSGIDWQCQKCSASMSAEYVKNLTTRLRRASDKIETLENTWTFIKNASAKCHPTHSMLLPFHVRVTTVLGASIFMCRKENLGDLQMDKLYSSSKALLNFYSSINSVFNHNTAIVLMYHITSLYYLQIELISRKGIIDWEEIGSLAVQTLKQLELCKDVFSSYASIPTYAEYLAHVSGMQTLFQNRVALARKREKEPLMKVERGQNVGKK